MRKSKKKRKKHIGLIGLNNELIGKSYYNTI